MLRDEALEQGVIKEITYNISVLKDGFVIIEVETETAESSFYGTSQVMQDIGDVHEHLLDTLAGAMEWTDPTATELERYYKGSLLC